MARFDGNAAKRVADTSAGPWTKWRIRSRHGRAIKFIETYCRSPKGEGFGKPLKLGKFQKAFLEETLADGVSVGALQTARGNGKSSGGGALGVWALFDEDETGAPQVPIVATTVGQAIRSCYGVGVAMIRAEPELLRRSLIFTGIGTSRVSTPFNGGEMFPISNEPNGLQGLDPSLAIIDEMGFQPLESYNSLRLAQGKRSRSLVIGLGTPGLDRENALFHLRETLREKGSQKGVVFHEYSAPENCALDDRAAWRAANPAIQAGFLRESQLETDLPITPEGLFRIFRLGQWHQGVDSWLGSSGAQVWERLTNPYGFTEGARTWVGVDMAIKHDTAAVVALQRRPDGRYHAVCRLWVPTDDRPVDATDVMQYLRELDERYDLVSAGFDPRFFDVPAKMLTDEGLPMIEVPQSLEHMTPAYVSLYEAIMSGKLTHDGDAAFTTQVLNGEARFSHRGFMLSKDKSRGKIDAPTALALAYDQMLRHEAEGPSIYEERGLLEFG